MAHRRASDAAGSGRGADAQTAVPDAGAITRRQRDEFAELARPHMGAMLRTAAALVGAADAEDVAQEALLRGMLAYSTLRERSALRAWLLRTTANVCADWQRGRFGSNRRLTLPLEGDPAALEGDPAALDATLPVDDSLGGVTHAARLDLRAAINGLEHALRLAVVLRYYAGLDATEIGAIMALPPSTVRSHLRRARLLLRRALDLPGDDSAPARERGGPRC